MPNIVDKSDSWTSLIVNLVKAIIAVVFFLRKSTKGIQP